TGAKRRGAVDAQSAGQFVGGLEAEAPDVGGQAVWVGPHDLKGLLSVGLVNAHGPTGADTLRLEEDHQAAHRLLLLPAFADALDAASADALDLLEEGWAFVNDGQGALAENLDDFPREVRADPLDQTGAEVFDDAFAGVRRRGAQLGGAELFAVVAVLHPGAARLDVLAGNDPGQGAHAPHLDALARHLDAQHREARIGIVKGDALDHAGQSFHHASHCTGAAAGSARFALPSGGGDYREQ